jgi:hypothetical protein
VCLSESIQLKANAIRPPSLFLLLNDLYISYPIDNVEMKRKPQPKCEIQLILEDTTGADPDRHHSNYDWFTDRWGPLETPQLGELNSEEGETFKSGSPGLGCSELSPFSYESSSI